MGNLLDMFAPDNEPKRVLCLGLDAAGKTTVGNIQYLI
jgi:hypothetical protein